jgi:hypothetical protein
MWRNVEKRLQDESAGMCERMRENNLPANSSFGGPTDHPTGEVDDIDIKRAWPPMTAQSSSSTTLDPLEFLQEPRRRQLSNNGGTCIEE